MVPQHHGRAIQQPGQENALHAEMAEEKEILCIGPFHPVQVSLPTVAVGFQNPIQIPGHVLIDLPDAAVPVGRGLKPVCGIVVHRLLHPAFRQKIPAHASGMECFGCSVALVKLPQPGADRGLGPHFLQRQRGGVPGTAKRRYIIGTPRYSFQPPAQKLCFPPALFRQSIVFIIRLRMADDVNVHSGNSPFFS